MSKLVSALEQQVLMAALTLHPNGYGISIQDDIKRRTKREPSLGRLNAALGRLEDKGWRISAS
jgi:PadR family transcriptional regulator PadR